MVQFWYKWHSRLGITAAIFVIFLSVSGIALNHSHGLGLNTSYIQSEWLLDLYGIKPDKPPFGFNIENNWVSQIGERIYFNKTEIAQDIENLFGMTKTDEFFVIAMSDRLTLLTEDGKVIEHLSGSEGVPAGMRAIGVTKQGNVIIKASHGFYQVDLDELEWKEFDHVDANWLEGSELPDELKKTLMKQYRGTGLTLERVMLDLHKGRLFGSWGVYIFDLAAFFFILLAFSGSWMWWMRR